MNDLVIPEQFEKMVHMSKNVPMTNSIKIADIFGKQHKAVLRAIDVLTCSDAFKEKHFSESQYLDERGKSNRIVEMTYAGQNRLVMGFTGAEANEWKENFVEAFEWLQSALMRQYKEAVNYRAECYISNKLENHNLAISKAGKEDARRAARMMERLQWAEFHLDTCTCRAGRLARKHYKEKTAGQPNPFDLPPNFYEQKPSIFADLM